MADCQMAVSLRSLRSDSSVSRTRTVKQVEMKKAESVCEWQSNRPRRSVVDKTSVFCTREPDSGGELTGHPIAFEVRDSQVTDKVDEFSCSLQARALSQNRNGATIRHNGVPRFSSNDERRVLVY